MSFAVFSEAAVYVLRCRHHIQLDENAVLEITRDSLPSVACRLWTNEMFTTRKQSGLHMGLDAKSLSLPKLNPAAPPLCTFPIS